MPEVFRSFSLFAVTGAGMTFRRKESAEGWLEDHGYRRHPTHRDTWVAWDEDAVVRIFNGVWSIDFHER